MNISYDQRLKEYMERKGRRHIVVEAISPIGCCADVTELTMRLVADDEAANLREKACRTLAGEMGDVLVLSRGLEYDEDIAFGLRNFLGVKDVTVRGLRAWKL